MEITKTLNGNDLTVSLNGYKEAVNDALSKAVN